MNIKENHPSIPSLKRRGRAGKQVTARQAARSLVNLYQKKSSPLQGEVTRKRRRGSIDQSSQPEDMDILILPKGSFPHLSGTQVIDSAAMRRIIGALDIDGRDIPVDYGHESFSSPRAPAAGWVKNDYI